MRVLIVLCFIVAVVSAATSKYEQQKGHRKYHSIKKYLGERATPQRILHGKPPRKIRSLPPTGPVVNQTNQEVLYLAAGNPGAPVYKGHEFLAEKPHVLPADPQGNQSSQKAARLLNTERQARQIPGRHGGNGGYLYNRPVYTSADHLEARPALPISEVESHQLSNFPVHYNNDELEESITTRPSTTSRPTRVSSEIPKIVRTTMKEDPHPSTAIPFMVDRKPDVVKNQHFASNDQVVLVTSSAKLVTARPPIRTTMRTTIKAEVVEISTTTSLPALPV